MLATRKTRIFNDIEVSVYHTISRVNTILTPLRRSIKQTEPHHVGLLCLSVNLDKLNNLQQKVILVEFTEC